MSRDNLRSSKVQPIELSAAPPTASIRKFPAQIWLEENAQALDASNSYVGQFGIPLARHRMF